MFESASDSFSAKDNRNVPPEGLCWFVGELASSGMSGVVSEVPPPGAVVSIEEALDGADHRLAFRVFFLLPGETGGVLSE